MLLGCDEVSELRGGGRHFCLRRGWAGQLGRVSLSRYNQAGSVSLGESEKWNQSLVQPECRSQAGRTLLETEKKEKISGDLQEQVPSPFSSFAGSPGRPVFRAKAATTWQSRNVGFPASAPQSIKKKKKKVSLKGRGCNINWNQSFLSTFSLMKSVSISPAPEAASLLLFIDNVLGSVFPFRQ